MPTFIRPASVTVRTNGGSAGLALLSVAAVLVIGSGIGADLLEGLAAAAIVVVVGLALAAAASLVILAASLRRTAGTCDTRESLAATTAALEGARIRLAQATRSRRAIAAAREQYRDEALAWALEQIAERDASQLATSPLAGKRLGTVPAGAISGHVIREAAR